ncbi:hypothetical protein Scep_010429 [Stephania cephalantha]|uniref:GATA-type domain-containing protein n=1 Tax=Stephania cephalantha TaxID=152367 RepID=A0AAP0JWB4_9MAGN
MDDGLGDAATIPLDALLDFSSDFDELDDDDVLHKKQFQKMATERPPQLSAPAESDSVVLQHGDREEEEEELEWISNQDAFPSIETTFDMNHQSPVSVLSSSTTTTTSAISYINNSFSFPVQAKRSKRKRSMKGSWGWFQPFKNRALTTSSLTEVLEVRKCTHCSAEKTPQWRAGPMGPKTLCNACGVRFKSGRLVPEYRPASSPSFSRELHSNSHRRILEMRRKKHKGNNNVQFTSKRN